jgi:hypothetical protein
MQDENADAGGKKEATEKSEKALEEGFAEVQTPSDASKTLDKIEATGAGVEEKDIPPEAGSSDPLEQAETIEAAADSASSKNRPAAVLATAAIRLLRRQLTSASRLMRRSVRQAPRPPRNPQKLREVEIFYAKN